LPSIILPGNVVLIFEIPCSAFETPKGISIPARGASKWFQRNKSKEQKAGMSEPRKKPNTRNQRQLLLDAGDSQRIGSRAEKRSEGSHKKREKQETFLRGLALIVA